MQNHNRQILEPLNDLLAANDRLVQAIQGTRQHWPYVTRCWIDEMSEPSALLAKYRLKPVVSSNGVDKKGE